MTAGSSSLRKKEFSGRKSWMCRYVAEGEKKKESKFSPIPRKLLLFMP